VAAASVGHSADEAAVVAVALDYFEGWFDGDVRRMERALHPGLAKRALESDGRALNETTAEWMLESTARALGRERDPGDRRIEVEVEDLHGAIASVTVRSAVYREYLHLVRTSDGWKIVNALWAWS
jgi:hypothetical protein